MNSIINDLIIIRGAPAVGKSETAKALTKYFPKGVRIEIDTIRSMVINPQWTDQKEHNDLLRVSAELIKGFMKLDFRPIIIVDTFSGNKLDKFIKNLNLDSAGLLIHIYSLFTSNIELKRRITLRKNDEFKDYSVCIKINEDTIRDKYNGEYQVDTTNMTPETTADFIYNLLTNITSV